MNPIDIFWLLVISFLLLRLLQQKRDHSVLKYLMCPYCGNRKQLPDWSAHRRIGVDHHDDYRDSCGACHKSFLVVGRREE